MERVERFQGTGEDIGKTFAEIIKEKYPDSCKNAFDRDEANRADRKRRPYLLYLVHFLLYYLSRVFVIAV